MISELPQTDNSNARSTDRRLRFLFAGPGYPGAEGTGSGSGIGTYMRELALGLTAQGHQCHALVWSEDGRPGESMVEGVAVHRVPRGYWKVIERFFPDSRTVWNRGQAVKQLDRLNRFD
jgi:hypothetical protein